jgi:hypothetical protein
VARFRLDEHGRHAGGVTMPQFNLSATDLANLAASVYASTHS